MATLGDAEVLTAIAVTGKIKQCETPAAQASVELGEQGQLAVQRRELNLQLDSHHSGTQQPFRTLQDVQLRSLGIKVEEVRLGKPVGGQKAVESHGTDSGLLNHLHRRAASLQTFDEFAVGLEQRAAGGIARDVGLLRPRKNCRRAVLPWYTFALHLSHAIALFLAGLIAGTLNAVAGGGSFISFPTLLFTGVPPVQANATNTVALWTGLAASGGAYLRRLNVPRKLLIPLLTTSVVGGLAGALLLVKTPQHTFLHLVPWLLLGATLLFMFGNRIRALAGKTAASDLERTGWHTIAVVSLAEFVVAVYGGYFGGGIGLAILAMLALMGMHDVHNMNALRTLLAAIINAAAVVAFIVARAVYWPQFLVMTGGALAGGWFGAHYAQKADPRKVRYFVIAVGLAMSAYFFYDTLVQPMWGR